MPQNEVSLLLTLIDQAFDHRAWHGTNLRGSIRGLRVDDVTWRPAPGRHNIWETVGARGLLEVHRCGAGFSRSGVGSFSLEGSNWFVRPTGGKSTEADWKNDVKLLVEAHRSMRVAVAGMSDAQLKVTPKGSKVSNVALITGIASHDLYHAGQIQLLKRLRPRAQ